jgi:hypothetical protein
MKPVSRAKRSESLASLSLSLSLSLSATCSFLALGTIQIVSEIPSLAFDFHFARTGDTLYCHLG